MRASFVVALALLVLTGCGEKQSCPVNSPCWLYDYEFGPVVEDTIRYEGAPTVTLLNGEVAQIHALGQGFRSVHDHSFGGYIYSYVLRPVDNPDAIIMETIGVQVAWNTIGGATLVEAMDAPAASRLERIGHVRDALKAGKDIVYHPRSGPPFPASSIVQEPPTGIVGDRLHCMIYDNFSAYGCPMPPP